MVEVQASRWHHHGQHAGQHVCASGTDCAHIATALGSHRALYDRIASPQFTRLIQNVKLGLRVTMLVGQ